ncbi:teichoic acid ABC transporter ATP-binding protein [Paenibacillus glucanolyticus]|uniref:Teichoic acid ABC transporter ATP-binding protein n=1 Tax=Paenibacillus glucanolyticus TaxID=59843 RepID=A0A163I204_9BACL|nr:ABC transporter ATP-binding protein [Paenibacillus glucanolyticus]KZS45754.1 teichoic acid ABC transporter ATP-binding protein [Paenibacillus glucanolyticus]
MHSKKIVIDVSNVSMTYRLYQEKVDSIKEYFVKLVKQELQFKEHNALNNISFQVAQGEIMGVVGLNGAGKSTLLKIVAGILKPSSGSINVNGNMAPLIELGAGFDEHLTGRENIYLNGSLLGHSNKFMRAMEPDIIGFAELGHFIDVPIKNYSSGMKARLGFSIATCTKPNVLIVDEVLSVGDFKFQQKCQARMKELLEGGTTVLFVSHSLGEIEKICDRTIWIDKGQLKMIGETAHVLNKFKDQE